MRINLLGWVGAAGMLFLSSAAAHAQGNVEVEAGVGAFAMKLPEINFSIIADTANMRTVLNRTDHDGDVRGAKYDAAIRTKVMNSSFGNVYVGASGFFAQADDNISQTCTSNGVASTCSFVSPFNPTNGPAPPSVQFSGQRDLRYNGVAVEASVRTASALMVTAGLDFRNLDQDNLLTGVNPTVPTARFSYSEQLDTRYLGAFIALAGKINLGNGFYVSGKGQIGAYRAEADYRGTYTGGVITGADNGSGSDSQSETTYIGSLRGELGYKIGGVSIAAFGEVESIGWVPVMRYDDNITAAWTPIDSATTIGDDNATSYTVGGRAKIKF